MTADRVGLGCMGMSWAYASRQIPEGVAQAVLLHAVGQGISHFDTNDIYGPYHNERLVGGALRRAGPQVEIATKGGVLVTDADNFRFAFDGRREHLLRAAEASRRRLGVDVIDLYYLDRIDPKVPLEESWSALADLVREGVVRQLGLGQATTEELNRAHRLHPVSAVQMELSLWNRAALIDVVPWCRNHGARFVAASPLARGFLTDGGASAVYPNNDFRSRLRWKGETSSARSLLSTGTAAVASATEATIAQVSLAWVLSRGDHITAIPGTTSLAHVDELIAAMALELNAMQLAALEDLPHVGSATSLIDAEVRA